MTWTDHGIEQTPEQRAITAWLQKRYDNRDRWFSGGACGCLGPMDGEPLCPCMTMYAVKVEDGWFKVTELYTPTGSEFKAEKLSPI
jgi:hypothetical protein